MKNKAKNMSFDKFIKDAKNTIEALNNGDDKQLLRKEKETISKEKFIQEELSSKNYIKEFNDFLNNLENKYIGKMLNFNYQSTQIITNDELLLKNKGLPKGSFLIATLKDFKNLDGIEHFILLFVNNFTKLEDNKENQLTLINHHKQLNLKDNKIFDLENNEEYEREKIQENSLKNISFVGLDCKIMGMFYRDSNNTFNFSSQVNLVLSPNNYYIAKPNKEIRNIIANYKTIINAMDNENKFNFHKIGVFSETEASIFTDENENPDIIVDLDVFKAKRTGFLSKTRLGKSNIVKIILSAFIEDNFRKTNTEIQNKTGFVIFDENGEYSNINTQDQTSLYDKYKQTGLVKKYTIDKFKNENVMLNFYINPSETMSVFNYLMSKDGSKSIYIESFLNVDFTSTNQLLHRFNTMKNPLELNKQDLFKFQLFWAMLNKAGFKYKPNNKENNHFFDFFSKIIKNPFNLANNIHEDLKKVYNENLEDELYILEENEYKEGDNLEIKFTKMCNLIDLFVDIRIHNPDYLIDKENKRKYLHFDALLEMFNTINKSGYKTLRKFIDFHSEKSNNNIEGLISDVCDNGIVSIIDLSTTTNSDVKQYYAQRIASTIFNEKIKHFIENKTNAKPNVLLHFEEAHNLFPSDSNRGGIYYKLAKEGAKYNIGIMYATQSPSNIYSELLTQTENFFIGHLSSPKEVSCLTSLSFSFEHLTYEILALKKVGQVKFLTDNHRYPIPVQIYKFT